MSSVSIVKASPDSKREFSVVTMLEEEEPSASATVKEEGKIGETSDLQDSKFDVSPIVSKRRDSVSGSVQTTTQDKELSTVQIVPSVSQGKDDIVEINDIKEVNHDENKQGDGRDEGRMT